MNRYSYFGDPDFSSGYYITDKAVNKYHNKRMARKFLEQEFGQER